MGGGKAGGEHGHGHGHGGDHGHHHKPRVYNSVINYHIPDPGHHVAEFKSPDWKIYKVLVVQLSLDLNVLCVSFTVTNRL